MNFKKLIIQNFFSYGAKQEISLEKRGLVAIFGENHEPGNSDSNGSGKSSIVNSLVWSLWGETIDGKVKGDAVINTNIGEDCLVSTIFENDGIQYQVTRTRGMTGAKKPNDVILYIDGENKTPGTNSDTQEFINNIIGMDKTTFCQAILLNAEGKSFPQMTDSEQKQVLEDILQIDTLTRAKEETKNRLDDKKLKLANLRTELTQLATQVNHFKVQHHKLYQQEIQFETLKTQRLDSLHLRLEQSLKELEVLRTTETPKSLQKELEAVDVKLKKIKDSLLRLQDDKEKIEGAARTVHFKLHSDIAVVTNEEKHVSSDMGTANQLVGKPCPTCRQLVDPDFVDYSLTDLNSKLQEYKNLRYMLETKQAEVDSNYQIQISENQVNQNKMDGDIKNLQATRQLCYDKIRKLEAAQGSIKIYEKQVSQIELEIKEVMKEQNLFSNLVLEAKKALSDYNSRYKSCNYKIKSLETEQSYLEYWYEAFGNKGIKSYLLDGALPYLNERVQYYADIISGGYLKITFDTQSITKTGDWKEKFSVNVTNLQGASTYEQNSQGERRRIDIATGWALGDLAATRANKSIRFKALDECFESLDATGIDSVIKLLHAVEKEYETILVISHSDTLKNQFNNTMTVVKENQFSRIKE